MRAVTIHEAKTHFSRLIEEAAQGKAFIIAKSGKPMVKVIPFSEEDQPTVVRLGFMAGEISVPDDFDRMEDESIAALFDGREP